MPIRFRTISLSTGAQALLYSHNERVTERFVRSRRNSANPSGSGPSEKYTSIGQLRKTAIDSLTLAPEGSTLKVKRIFDIVGSLLGFAVFGCLIVTLVILVRLTSKGPGIFAQHRVGQRGEIFRCYKIRTMWEGTPAEATHEINRSSVTPVGRILRRFKLDELPQIWNVLKGEMSLVGPRPCLPSQQRLIQARRERGVLEAKPGITGRSQVLGLDMSEPERLATADAEYVAAQSLLGDLVLLMKTPGALLFGSGKPE
jgi:O-antigen biosynthesis protein WbqP